LVPRYAEHTTLRATSWALHNSSAKNLTCAKLLSGFVRPLFIPSLSFLCLAAQGLGYQNEQEGAQTGSGYSFPVCHSQHSHCGRLKGEKHCFSCCTILQSHTVDGAQCVAATTDLHCQRTAKPPDANTKSQRMETLNSDWRVSGHHDGTTATCVASSVTCTGTPLNCCQCCTLVQYISYQKP